MAAEDYPWLTQEVARVACKVATGNTDALARVETARMAAAEWCQDQRRDLFATVEDVETFVATPRVVQAAALATARLYVRADSANGLVSFGEYGPASILRRDPDVVAMIGRRRTMAGG